MKQTAVEIFYHHLSLIYGEFLINRITNAELSAKILLAFADAIELEEEQIMAAHEAGAMNLQGGIDNFNFFQENSHYYNEVYGGSHAE
jgi:hypothetical protein